MKPEKAENIYIIGMSPGNSYFKDEEIKYLLHSTVEKYGKVYVMIADVPAISTYIAYGYSELRAQKDKAIPQGKLLKNRVLRAMVQLGYSSDQVHVINWAQEVESDSLYIEEYQKIRSLYDSSDSFRGEAESTTRDVLVGSKKEFPDLEASVKIAVHYLLSEMAFLEWSAKHFPCEKMIYIYHKNWPIYENYIVGKYDGKTKDHLHFWLLENPWETYNSVWGAEDYEPGNYRDTLERIESTKVMRVAFTNYPPALMYDHDYDNFSGIAYEIIVAVARKHGWQLKWSEETGYGVIIDGLSHGRFDFFGSVVWPTPERKEKADMSRALYESDVYLWVREDQKEIYDAKRKSGELRIAIKENDISHSIALADFPDARCVYVPQLTDTVELLQFVADDKADMTFVEPYLAEVFNRTSSVPLVHATDVPVRRYENVFVFLKTDTRLRELFDKEIAELEANGTIDSLLKKYQFA
jgi:tRNA-dependent cyclodipeptide synthase